MKQNFRNVGLLKPRVIFAYDIRDVLRLALDWQLVWPSPQRFSAGRLSIRLAVNIHFFIWRTEHGINERYSDVMTSLEDLLEDTILFSTFIAEELSNRGRELAEQLGKKAPEPFSWSFREIEDPSLMPAESRRPDWMKSVYN